MPDDVPVCEWPTVASAHREKCGRKARSYVQSPAPRAWGRHVCGTHERRAVGMGWRVADPGAAPDPLDASAVYEAGSRPPGHVCDPDAPGPIVRERQMVVLRKPGPDRRGGVWCDPCIAHLVAALNLGGVPTVASCCGHGKRSGSIILADGTELVVRYGAFLPSDVSHWPKGLDPVPESPGA